jgi:hypothetical protein
MGFCEKVYKFIAYRDYYSNNPLCIADNYKEVCLKAAELGVNYPIIDVEFAYPYIEESVLSSPITVDEVKKRMQKQQEKSFDYIIEQAYMVLNSYLVRGMNIIEAKGEYKINENIFDGIPFFWQDRDKYFENIVEKYGEKGWKVKIQDLSNGNKCLIFGEDKKVLL